MASRRSDDATLAKPLRVLLATSEPGTRAWLEQALAGGFDVLPVERGQDLLDAVAAGRGDVIVIGPGQRDMEPAALLAALEPRDDASGPGEDDSEGAAAARALPDLSVLPPVLLIDDHGPARTGDSERVFYVLGTHLAPEDVRTLVRSACARPASAPGPESVAEATRLQRVLEISRQLAAQRELDGASGVVLRALSTLVEADRGYCLFYDAESGALWAEDEAHPYDGSAARGMAGFAARTAMAAHAPRAGDDPRYCREVDDPAGDGSEHLALQPVVGGDGVVHAVLVAVRRAEAADFSPEDRGDMALLAEHAAPLFDLLSRHIESKAAIEAERSHSLFRQEAIDAHLSWEEHGDVLRVSPGWLGWTYWLLLLVCVSGAIYVSVGTVHEYSTGLAVVRTSGRTEVTAKVAGTIAEVLVVPGKRVRDDEVLVRLYSADAAAEYRRIEEEFEAQLRNLLRSPGDPGLRQTVASLRSLKERAASELEERLIRAPHGGTISDVRIRAGQALSPGDVLLSLMDDESDLDLIALLPGGDRPLIAPGMPMRLELTGYQYAYQELTVESVADQVIGPAEASRFLGPVIGDSVVLSGPVVLIRARLPSLTFNVDDREYRYHDGMQGIAEVRVRARTIVETLFPELRRL